jgi:uncharacterized protein YdhG (YjbR/CyaY superfamily)
MADTKKRSTKPATTGSKSGGKPVNDSRSGNVGEWTAEEKAAMKEHAREIKIARGKAKPDGAAELRAKIDEMTGNDRALAEKIHAIVMRIAPDLEQRTWYGMPAYAKDGKVLCFFQPAAKFKARYATLGFDERAKLDEGGMWPTSWALQELSPADEKLIAELVKKATS